MANTAPGTPYVESSDLVANYPAVSESLAERVDLVGILPFTDSTARATALPTPTDGQYSYLQDTNATEFWNGSAWVAAGTAPGLVHINTTTFSAVTSVNVNSVFSATYDIYLIIPNFTACSGSNMVPSMRLRASGTDSIVNYYQRRSLTDGSTTSLNNNPDGTTLFGLGFSSTGDIANASILIHMFNPFAATNTATQIHLMQSTGLLAGYAFGGHTVATSYDGFSLSASTGTITGTVRTYGYKNS